MKKIPILALAAVAVLAGCGGGAATSRQRTLVQMSAGDQFTPKTVMVPAGSKIRWTNADTDVHTVEPDVADVDMDSDTMFPNGLPPGASFEWEVPSSAASGQKYYYHCRLHGTAGDGTDFGTGMAGVIIVQ